MAKDMKKAPKAESTTPAGVSQGDGDGQKIPVSSEAAKAAPKAGKSVKINQGEAASMPKSDKDGRHC